MKEVQDELQGKEKKMKTRKKNRNTHKVKLTNWREEANQSKSPFCKLTRVLGPWFLVLQLLWLTRRLYKGKKRRNSKGLPSLFFVVLFATYAKHMSKLQGSIREGREVHTVSVRGRQSLSFSVVASRLRIIAVKSLASIPSSVVGLMFWIDSREMKQVKDVLFLETGSLLMYSRLFTIYPVKEALVWDLWVEKKKGERSEPFLHNNNKIYMC